jgi:hypothetical protein
MGTRLKALCKIVQGWFYFTFKPKSATSRSHFQTLVREFQNGINCIFEIIDLKRDIHGNMALITHFFGPIISKTTIKLIPS